MDGITEFLKVSPLNGYPPVKPRDSLSPVSFFSETFQNPNGTYVLQPTLVPFTSPQAIYENPPAPSSSHSADIGPSYYTMSGGEFSQQPTFTLLTSSSKAPWNTPPTPDTPVSLVSPGPGDVFPSTPAIEEAHDDDYSMSEPDGEGSEMNKKTPQKGRQRGSGSSLSAHAIYARMNRERKKTYMVEMEKYRNTMRKKRNDDQKELEAVRQESNALAQEIARLKGELTGNQTLMNLLSIGGQQRKG